MKQLYNNFTGKSLALLLLGVLLFTACQKQELFNKEIPQVVKLTIEGGTTGDLEFVYKDSVVASVQGSTSGGFARTVLLNTAGTANPELFIREAGASENITSKPIPPAPFSQSLSIYYDNGKIYRKQVRYTIKGYAMSGDLEFLIDGKTVFTGSSKIDETLSVLVNENEPRQLEVRKVGETVALITDEIETDVAEQSLGFFFDGTEIVSGIEVAPPTNPENMAITAQFKTQYTDPGSNTLYFTGGNEVDLVFYTRKKGTENKNRTTPENKVDPEIRIPIPLDGTFVSFELPFLSDESMEYSFDFVEKGTDSMPYVRGTTASSTYPELRANQGRYGNGIIVEPGQSKLLLISDGFKGITQAPRHRIPIPAITDLSEYFQ